MKADLQNLSQCCCTFRDDAQNKMMALKEKAEKELAHYNMELKELIRVIDHDRKLREFMGRKDQERTEAHEEMEAMKRKKEYEKSSERDRTVMVSDKIEHTLRLLYLQILKFISFINFIIVFFFCCCCCCYSDSHMSKHLNKLRMPQE